MSTEVLDKPLAEMFLEILDKGDSGFILDKTEGTPFEERIDCAGLAFIPNTGKMSEEIKDAAGKGTGKFKNVNIRYIKDCPYIKTEEQEKNGWTKSKLSSTDTIAIIKGKALIKREGDVALFDYLASVFYNLDAPNRPRSAKALFKINRIVDKIDTGNEAKFLQAKAINFVETLVTKTGPKAYKFKEAAIDNIISLLGVFGGDNYSEKITVLTNYAEKNPVRFLDAVTKLVNVTVQDVSVALELAVIQFDGASVQEVGSKKVLATLSSTSDKVANKVGEFAELLQTPEYAQTYVELKVKIEQAKEVQLQK